MCFQAQVHAERTRQALILPVYAVASRHKFNSILILWQLYAQQAVN